MTVAELDVDLVPAELGLCENHGAPVELVFVGIVGAGQLDLACCRIQFVESTYVIFDVQVTVCDGGTGVDGLRSDIDVSQTAGTHNAGNTVVHGVPGASAAGTGEGIEALASVAEQIYSILFGNSASAFGLYVLGSLASADIESSLNIGVGPCRKGNGDESIGGSSYLVGIGGSGEDAVFDGECACFESKLNIRLECAFGRYSEELSQVGGFAYRHEDDLSGTKIDLDVLNVGNYEILGEYEGSAVDGHDYAVRGNLDVAAGVVSAAFAARFPSAVTYAIPPDAAFILEFGSDGRCRYGFAVGTGDNLVVNGPNESAVDSGDADGRGAAGIAFVTLVTFVTFFAGVALVTLVALPAVGKNGFLAVGEGDFPAIGGFFNASDIEFALEGCHSGLNAGSAGVKLGDTSLYLSQTTLEVVDTIGELVDLSTGESEEEDSCQQN